MTVKASIVGSHRFDRVRRRGYDPVEVDAVMARIATTLHWYEQRVAYLEDLAGEAEDSSRAIRRTFAAAQRTHDDMVSEAEHVATTLRRQAYEEAERVIEDCKQERDRIRAEAAAMLAEANATSTELVASARELAAAATASATEEADTMVRDARESSERSAREADAASRRILETAREHAERIVSDAAAESSEQRASAQRQSAQILTEARSFAAEVVREARQEKRLLERRLAELRSAVTNVEREVNSLAELALERIAISSSVIDLEIATTKHAGPGEEDDDRRDAGLWPISGDAGGHS